MLLIAGFIILLFLIIFLVMQKVSNENTTVLDDQLLKSLKQVENPNMTPTNLGEGLMPPTNKWFSGVVFTDKPQPIYSLPLSFKPSVNGFSFGVPLITTLPKTISGGFNPAVDVVLPKSTSYTVIRYDYLSVTLQYKDASGQVLADVTIAHGVPYITFNTATDTEVVINNVQDIKKQDNIAYWQMSGRDYGIKLRDGLMVPSSNNSKVQLNLKNGENALFFAVADGMDPLDTASKISGLNSTETNYKTNDDSINTEYSLITDKDASTLFTAMPHQNIEDQQEVGTYPSIYGKMTVYSGTKFSNAEQNIEASDTLNIDNLEPEDREIIIAQLKIDSESTVLTKTDSYFGAKELYRAANIMQLADKLNQQAEFDSLKRKISLALEAWFNPAGHATQSNYFYYDTTVKGIVAAQPSYGSEDFNDHHFHYGYFIYAAAVLASHDEDFKEKHKAFVNLLVADIASTSSTEYFPALRNFDPYTGHSWASGNGQFADGNNQESSSEAINAWNSTLLWAQTVKDSQMQATAEWMLSSEIASARAYWTNFNQSEDIYKNFSSSVVSLNWGGKRDYATFFSPDPNVQLGIQLIPMNPVMKYHGDDKSRVQKNTESSLKDGKYSAQFGDYLLMYRSLYDREGAFNEAQELPIEFIDDGNSRSYMYAWILAN